MDLAADAKEWARWTVKSSAELTDPPEVELTLQPATVDDEPEVSDWIVLEWEADAVEDSKGRSVRTGRLLIQGPDVSGTAGEPLESGVYTTRLRVSPAPEVIPRDTESITVGSSA